MDVEGREGDKKEKQKFKNKSEAKRMTETQEESGLDRERRKESTTEDKKDTR